MAPKKKSAYMEGLLEQQRRLKLEAELKEREQEKVSESTSENSTQEEPHSPTPILPTNQKVQKQNKGKLQKVSCYLRPDQVELWDELTYELRMKIKKMRLDYKDIDRQVILREIFDTINQEQIEKLLTAKRSNSRTS